MPMTGGGGHAPHDNKNNNSNKMRAEMHVSVLNPNRFDVDVTWLRGTMRFPHGALFDMSWSSRLGGLETLPGGSLWDTRFVLELDLAGWKQLERLIHDAVRPGGLDLRLDMDMDMGFRLFGVAVSPVMTIAQRNVVVRLADMSTALCKCDPLPWEGLPPRRRRSSESSSSGPHHPRQ